MLNQRDVLRSPFDVEVHKRTFIHYLEVIILEDGTVVYAVPSHQEKLIELACQKRSLSREELIDSCPPARQFDYMEWLLEMTGCIALWNDFMVGKPNSEQEKTIQKLRMEKLFFG